VFSALFLRLAAKTSIKAAQPNIMPRVAFSSSVKASLKKERKQGQAAYGLAQPCYLSTRRGFGKQSAQAPGESTRFQAFLGQISALALPKPRGQTAAL
jgi:hypothetical protein